MKVNYIHIIGVALMSLISAAVTDFDALKQSQPEEHDLLALFSHFDWAIALPRYFKAVVLGVLAAFGVGQL